MGAYDNDQQSGPVSESRRGFLKIAIAALTFMSGVVLGLPFIRTIYRSAPVMEPGWSEVTKLAALPLNKPTSIRFPTQSEDAFIRGHCHPVCLGYKAFRDRAVCILTCLHASGLLFCMEPGHAKV